MFRTIIIIVLGAILIGAAYWLISPLWRTVELDEPIPIGDAMHTMDVSTKAEFERQTDVMKGIVLERSEPMPGIVLQLAKATMKPRAHEVSGRAMLLDTTSGKLLRFEDLETVNGPDLRVYLAADLSDKDVVDLGPIRATKGNVNYVLPSGTDTAKYHIALIWCRAFGVLFSYAIMQ